MTAKLRLSVIGCGRISHVHLMAVQEHPEVELISVADTDASAAECAAEAYGVEVFVDPLELLESTQPEAVILCTPPNSHRTLAVAALRNGAHVLCEKPLAVTASDAEVMTKTARETGRQLMMASKFRYMDDLKRARAILQSEILGEIILLENEFCSRVDMRNRWNSDREVSGGGVLIDNGTHSVDIVHYLLGPIVSLQALRGKQWQDIEVEDTCRVFLRTQDDAMASIDLSWSIHKQSPYFVFVYGTEGMLQVGWEGSRYRQSEKLHWVDFGSGYDRSQAVAAQLENFVGTTRGTAEPLITPEAALESVRAIQTAYRSAEQNHWLKVSG